MDDHLTTRLARLAAAARASRQLADDDREARDDAIADADQQRLPVRTIARWVQMSPSAVHSVIIARAAARAAAPAPAAS